MSVEVCYDAARQVATMFCNTQELAFGPIFKGVGAGAAAEDFLSWLRAGNGDGNHHRILGDGTDPRDYAPEQLEEVMARWQASYQADGDGEGE